jgi:putative spermidine/putrescine transport system permease protein
MASTHSSLQRFSAAFQITPLGVTLLLFLIGPVVVIIWMSFHKFNGFMTLDELSVANYVKVFTRTLTWDNYVQTAKMVAITWVVTTVLGFTLAYFLVFDLIKLRTKLLLFMLCVVPFWTSGVIRLVAWVPFLGKEGIINQALIGIGITDEPFQFLLFSEFAVLLSHVQIFTLFMMAPIFNTMARINRDLIEAARDNGASSWQILWNVIVPLCKPGIAIGTIFVVSLVVSDFTAIRILSGARVGTVSMSMSNQMSMVQYPPASASAMVLLVVLLLIVGGIMRVVDVRKQL